MKKNPSHPLAFRSSGTGLSDIGAYLLGLSKAALIDAVCDSLELQEISTLDDLRDWINPRLAVRKDREPMATVLNNRRHNERHDRRRDEATS